MGLTLCIYQHELHCQPCDQRLHVAVVLDSACPTVEHDTIPYNYQTLADSPLSYQTLRL